MSSVPQEPLMKMMGILRSRSSCLNQRQTSMPDISGMLDVEEHEIGRVDHRRLDGEPAARDRPGHEAAALQDRGQERAGSLAHRPR